MKQTYFFLFVIFFLWGLTGCNNQSKVVRIVLPKGSKGVFFVKQDVVEGSLVATRGQKITLTIPNNGKLIIKDAGFLFDWHSTTVTYDDGETIPFIASVRSVKDNFVACWELFSTSDTQYYFIGTLSEEKKFSDLSISKLGPFFLRQIKADQRGK